MTWTRAQFEDFFRRSIMPDVIEYEASGQGGWNHPDLPWRVECWGAVVEANRQIGVIPKSANWAAPEWLKTHAPN